MHEVRPLIFFALALCCAQPGRAADRGSQEDQQQELAPVAEAAKYPDLETTLKEQMHLAAQVPETPLPAATDQDFALMMPLLALGALLAASVGWQILRLLRRLFQETPEPEDKEFSEFMK